LDDESGDAVGDKNHDRGQLQSHSTDYDPVNPDTDPITPANMTEEQLKKLEFLKNLPPDKLQQFMTMMMLQQNGASPNQISDQLMKDKLESQDPETRREALRKKLRDKRKESEFHRSGKINQQRTKSQYEKEQEQEQEIVKASTAVDTNDDNSEPVIELADSEIEDLDSLPSMTTNVENVGDVSSDVTPSLNRKKAEKVGGRRGGKKRGGRKK
jgi:hypothetical protein